MNELGLRAHLIDLQSLQIVFRSKCMHLKWTQSNSFKIF